MIRLVELVWLLAQWLVAGIEAVPEVEVLVVVGLYWLVRVWCAVYLQMNYQCKLS